jgi:hypothetical protein
MKTPWTCALGLLWVPAMGACSANVKWTEGTWIADEYYEGQDNLDTGFGGASDCGMVAYLKGLDEPLAFTLGGSGEDFWQYCDAPWPSDPSFYCGADPFRGFHPTVWSDMLTEMGEGCVTNVEWIDGLMITEDELYLSAHYALECESSVGIVWSRHCGMQVHLRSKASGG